MAKSWLSSLVVVFFVVVVVLCVFLLNSWRVYYEELFSLASPASKWSSPSSFLKVHLCMLHLVGMDIVG